MSFSRICFNTLATPLTYTSDPTNKTFGLERALSMRCSPSPKPTSIITFLNKFDCSSCSVLVLEEIFNIFLSTEYLLY